MQFSAHYLLVTDYSPSCQAGTVVPVEPPTAMLAADYSLPKE